MIGLLKFSPFIILVYLHSALANRISESIYEDLDASHSCFKITNATNEFGCQSDFSGNVGVVAVANSTTALEALLKSKDMEPVVVVLPRALFTVATLQQLEAMSADPNRAVVKGVLFTVADGSWQPSSVHFSEDEVCPNQMSSLYRSEKTPQQYRDYCAQRPWNPDGTTMFRRHWTFPIILLSNRTQISYLYDCHMRFNAGTDAWPRCAAQMRTFMAAAGNTEICWRRTTSQYINTKGAVYCMPMGSQNVFGTLHPPEKSLPVVMLAARTDGFTMFDALAPAADSAAVGMVALLSIARTLANLSLVEKPRVNAMFMLFSGESFDYIGSDRFVWDMSRDRFPPLSVKKEDDGSPVRPPHMHISDLQAYLELSQLAVGSQLFMHSDPVSRTNATVDQKVSDLVSVLANFSRRYSLAMYESGRSVPLPPASLQTLLKAGSTLPGLVVADHADAYTNRHYHSVYDTAAAIGAERDADALLQRLTKVTQVVTSALYSMIAGSGDVPDVSVDQTWLRSALECYLERSNCSLFRSVMDERLSEKRTRDFWSKGVPLPTYVSVAGSRTRHMYLMQLTLNLLAAETGSEVANKKDDCKAGNNKTYSYRWLVREFDNGTRQGYCSRSLFSSSDASSPAFEIDDYDWSSGEHPSWAESEWVSFTLRLFLKPSIGHDVTHLVVGLLATLVAVVLVSLLERRSHMVFTSPRYPLLTGSDVDRRYGTVAQPVAS